MQLELLFIGIILIMVLFFFVGSFILKKLHQNLILSKRNLNSINIDIIAENPYF
jgi:uncharacterized protein YneF (UPF0154 family)